MSQRPMDDFKIDDFKKRKDVVVYPMESIKDLNIGRGVPTGWHYLGDSKITDKNNRSHGSWQETDESKKVKQFVEAIEKGDLDYIKKMDPKELKKYINEAVIRNDVLPLPPGVKWFMEPSQKEIEEEWAERGAVPGYTPLMLAAMEGKTDIMRYLVDQGALTTLKNLEGRSAADYLKSYNNKRQEKSKFVDPSKEKKGKDELGALMDEVDGKGKPEKKPDLRPLPGIGDKRYTTRYGAQPACKLEKNKTAENSKGQYGNGKGIDDKIGALQEKNELMLNKMTEKNIQK